MEKGEKNLEKGRWENVLDSCSYFHLGLFILVLAYFITGRAFQ